MGADETPAQEWVRKLPKVPNNFTDTSEETFNEQVPNNFTDTSEETFNAQVPETSEETVDAQLDESPDLWGCSQSKKLNSWKTQVRRRRRMQTWRAQTWSTAFWTSS